MNRKLRSILSAVGLSLALGGLALAEPPPGDGPPPPHHGHRPPEEAFTACANHADGDSCTVTFGDHTVEGKCRPVPPHAAKEDAGKLVCMPPHPPHHDGDHDHDHDRGQP